MASDSRKTSGWKRKPVPVPRPKRLEKNTARDLMAPRPRKMRFVAPESKIRPKGDRLEWTREHDDIVRKNYTKHGSVYTAQLLGRSKQSVQHRALRLGVPGHGIRPWTKKEVAYLRLQYPKLPVSKICRILKRTEQSVRGKIHILRLGSEPSRPWTQSELAYLRKHYGTVKVSELAKELQRTRDAVELKAGRIGLSRKIAKFTKADELYVIANLGKESFTVMAARRGTSLHHVKRVARANGYQDRPTSRPWTPDDDSLLRKIYSTMPHSEVAQQLNRTELAIILRARGFGLRSTFRGKRPAVTWRAWTPQEDTRLRRLYETHTAKEIAEKLDRSFASITGRIKQLGLRKE